MFFSDKIYKNNPRDIKEITSFLEEYGIKYDNPEKTYVIRDNGKIIATGSVDGNILKYFFSKDEYKGKGLMATIYNSLLTYLLNKGVSSYFVFTTPNNKKVFKSLGLKEVLSTSEVSLFEGGFYNYNEWIKKVKGDIGEANGIRGSIIMNCNPMTLGHKYLIDQSYKKVDELIIFIVEEDKSVFPFIDRIDIVKKELEDKKNIKIIPSGPYIISRGTFPTYFLKEKNSMLKVYTELDGSIFAKKIAKDLEISKRFLGSEPEDIVTNQYNKTLEKVLSKEDIETIIIPRKELDNKIISASKVRELLSEGKVEESYKYLTDSSIEYLKSQKGKEIINKLIK